MKIKEADEIKKRIKKQYDSQEIGVTTALLQLKEEVYKGNMDAAYAELRKWN
jgi:hypothetical protein|tara:strand:- start:590 stop:745 length:156 start_codon:yes stop_codon:yes gene_type:complete